MNIIQILFYIVALMLPLALIFILRKKAILSFLNPQDWVEVEMLEVDNNVRNWLQKKNNELSFVFNKGRYYMFTGENKNTTPSIYRKGRLAKLYYIEGNSHPLDFRNIKLTGDPYLNMQLDSINLSGLFFEDDSGIMNLIKKYWWVILGLGIIILILNNIGG